MIEEQILEPILDYYFSVPLELILEPNVKERVGTIGSMKIIIYSNDHNPPHFHVLSNDGKLNVKFTIEHCDLLSGKIDSKNLKRIKAFYSDQKTQIIMKKIWEKRNNSI